MVKKVKRKAPMKRAPMRAQKRRKKRRGSAAKRNASREVMNRPVKLSTELAEVVGSAALSRPEAVKRIWAYCKEKKLLNPKDQREILCDARLKKLLGKKSTTMFGLSGLLVPHFDFSADVEQSEDDGKEDDSDDDDEDEEEEEAEQDTEMISERSSKRGTKMEFRCAKSEVVAQSLALKIVRLERGAVTLQFTAHAGEYRFEAVATPANKTSAKGVIRAPCVVQCLPSSNGHIESSGEVSLNGLDPVCAYTIAIEVNSQHGGTATAMSPEVEIPQCAQPRKWSAREVQLWCRSMQVPDLAQKVKEYRVDGPTLLSFTEADLQGIGISTPFIVRRVLSSLRGLGGG